MKPRRRTDAMLYVLALLFLTAALAGCIGSDSGGDGTEDAADDGPGGDDAEDPGGDGEDPEDPGDAGNAGNGTDEDPVLEEEVFTFDGGGTGAGISATGSNFWILSSGFTYDVEVPETFANGTLTLRWDGTQTTGGMLVWVQDDAGETVHVFQADASPLEVELEADDERLEGAAEFLVLPDQGTPATVHVQVQWTGELTLMVPADVGDGAEA